MNIIFLGAPGAGKGTQAAVVSQKLAIPTISTGDMIRAAIKNGTEMGLKAKEYTSTGALVPDEVVIGIVRERLSADDCKRGFILDGFPRTIPQAEALDEMGVKIDKVIELYVEDEQIVKRMSGRRVCPKCGATYHTETLKPRTEGICDKCGEALIQRVDDAPETVLNRLKVYHKETEPLKEYYDKKGALAVVEGLGSIDEITAKTLAALEE